MTEAKHTPEAIALADKILRASGSNLKNYDKGYSTYNAILDAAQEGIDASKAGLLEAWELLKQCNGGDDFIGWNELYKAPIEKVRHEVKKARGFS